MLPPNARPLARLVLWSLLIAFVVSRVFSILIMLHEMPDLYLHVRGTHVHHLNYGIFLLAGVGAYLLFTPGPAAPAAAVIYGIGLGLTFDEFGMWLHLNGDYWQRASFDAVIVLAAALGLAGFAPPFRRWRPRQFAAVLLLLLLLAGTMRLAAKVQPRLQQWREVHP
jgi:multisubunit Na+/H+ antiporter MnhG subunit